MRVERGFETEKIFRDVIPENFIILYFDKKLVLLSQNFENNIYKDFRKIGQKVFQNILQTDQYTLDKTKEPRF